MKKDIEPGRLIVWADIIEFSFSKCDSLNNWFRAEIGVKIVLLSPWSPEEIRSEALIFFDPLDEEKSWKANSES